MVNNFTLFIKCIMGKSSGGWVGGDGVGYGGGLDVNPNPKQP